MTQAAETELASQEPVYVGLRTALLASDFVVLLISLGMYTQHDLWGYAFYGALCTTIVHLPIVLRIVPALSIWGVLAFVVTIGAGIRGVAIAVGYPDRSTITYLFTRGVPFEDLVPEALVTVACVLLLTIGFMATAGNYAKGRSRAESGQAKTSGLTTGHAPAWLFPTLIAGYSIAGAIGTLLYYSAVGGLTASISDRRTTYTGETDYASYGVVQFLAGAGVVGLLLFLAYRLSSQKRWTPATWVVLGALVINAFAINWVTTTRADLLYVAFGVLLVIRLVKGRLPAKIVVSLALVVILGIGLLSQSRSAEQGVDTVGEVSLSVGIDSGLLNRNAFDLSKTLLISDAVPEVLPLEGGATIGNYVFAPVPREVWPDKPVVSPGPVIGQRIYGLTQTGVPPGLVGEMVWNFGRTPAPFLSGLAGLGLGLLSRLADSWSHRRVALVLVHAMVLLPFGKAIMGVALGQALSAAGQALVLLLPLLLIDRRLARSASKKVTRKRGSRWAPRGATAPRPHLLRRGVTFGTAGAGTIRSGG